MVAHGLPGGVGAAVTFATTARLAGRVGASYEDEVLADSPLLYLRLGESSGTTATDSSGNGYDGTYAAGVTLGATGLVGDADTAITPSSSNANQCYVTNATVSTNITDEHTIEVWVKLNDATANALQIFADKTALSPNSNRQWYIGWENRSSQGSPQRLQWGWWSGLNSTLTYAAAGLGDTLEAGAHIVITTSDTNGIKMYVNGSEVTTSGSGVGNITNTLQLTVGGSAAGTSFRTQGTVDEFAFYDSELSSTRVAAHYNAA